MKLIDIRLKSLEIEYLKSIIGKRLLNIKHDPFRFVNSSSQIVQLDFESRTYYLYSFTEPLDYYGAIEDVAVWSLETEKYGFVDKKAYVATPFNEVVKSISIVQENQQLYKNDEKIYDVWLTRGIIIDFGEHQLSFEKAVWFSEEIYIQKGYDLISTFQPVDNFINSDWDEGVTAKCTREIITIS